jgi:hypothetical protein
MNNIKNKKNVGSYKYLANAMNNPWPARMKGDF